MKMQNVLTLLAILLFPMAGQAESAALDEVVVTGSRLSYSDYFDIPSVTLRQAGDRLSMSITLSNDSRDGAQRERELRDTVTAMIREAGADITVHSILQSDNDDDLISDPLSIQSPELRMVADPKRPDVSNLSLMVRIGVAEASDGKPELKRLKQFLAGLRGVGRTERINIDDAVAVSIDRPERFREPILKAIAEDLALLRSLFGSECRIDIQGLNNRVQWARATVTELLLYIPYETSLAECGATPSN